jgi:hypothetical protein
MRTLALAVLLPAGMVYAQTEPCSLKVIAQLVDKNLNLKPVPKLKLSARELASTRHLPLSTGFDGTVDINVPCGTYLLASDGPLDFDGKQFIIPDHREKRALGGEAGCLTVSGAATGHHAISLC